MESPSYPKKLKSQGPSNSEQKVAKLRSVEPRATKNDSAHRSLRRNGQARFDQLGVFASVARAVDPMASK